ncbi:MAG: hypothetical protein PHQ27_07910 [Victivallales bacterium]|nr:hypothetical protein [Victivallales bacterium]
MKVSSLIAAAAVIVCCGFPLQAKNNNSNASGQKNPALATESRKAEFQLTKEQATKLKPIIANVRRLMISCRKELAARQGDAAAIQAKIKTYQGRIDQALAPAKKFLTEEQFQKLAEDYKIPASYQTQAAKSHKNKKSRRNSK